MGIQDMYQDYVEADKRAVAEAYEKIKEEKLMEKKEITTKQAVRALKRNFKRWCSDHFVLLAGIGTGAAAAAAIGTYAIWNHLNNLELESAHNIETDRENMSTSRWIDQQYLEDHNLITSFVMASADGKNEFDLKPDELGLVLDKITEGYKHDYDLFDTVNKRMVTYHYEDGSTKVEFE